MAWLYLHELQDKLDEFETDKVDLRSDIKDAAIRIRNLKRDIEYIQGDVDNGEFTQTYADELCEEKQDDILGLETDIQNAIENLKDIEDDDDYAELKRVISEIKDYNTERYTALIPVGKEFENYIRDYCEDVGLVGKDPHGIVVIDWEATAANFSDSFVEITYDGQDYMMEAR